MGGRGLDLRDARGERLQPVVTPRERQVWREVQRHDLQGLTLIRYWASSHTAPIWLWTTWPNPEEALEGYLMRMPIERPFFSGLENPAPWGRQHESAPALNASDRRPGGLYWGNGLPGDWTSWRRPSRPRKRQWFACSGLFTLLRVKSQLPPPLRRA